LIASGGYPSKSDFPGADLCIDSNGVFDLEVLPKSMVVIGGGYIGIEIAQIMNAFGVKVTLVVREIMLRFVDAEVVQLLCEQMKLSGIDLRLHSPHESVHREGESLSVKLKNGDKISCDTVLLAIGRPPNVK
jgi:glutathione reductase (NADPH)